MWFPLSSLATGVFFCTGKAACGHMQFSVSLFHLLSWQRFSSFNAIYRVKSTVGYL